MECCTMEPKKECTRFLLNLQFKTLCSELSSFAPFEFGVFIQSSFEIGAERVIQIFRRVKAKVECFNMIN